MLKIITIYKEFLKKVFLNKNFTLLWLSQTVNIMGNKLSIFALPLVAIYVYDTNILQTSMVTAFSFLPNLIFGSFIGVFVDKHNKRNICIICNLICFALSILLFILSINKILSLSLFYFLIFVLNSFMIFNGVSFYSQLTLVLDSDEYKKGNHRLEISNSVLSAIAPSISGIIITIVSAPFVFLIDGFTFLFSSFFQLFIKNYKEEKLVNKLKKENTSYFKHIRDSYKFVFSNDILSKIAVSYFITVFGIGIFQSIQFYYLKKYLSIDTIIIGYILSVGNIFTVLSSIFSYKISNKIGSGKSLVLSLSCYSLSFLFYFLGKNGNLIFIIIGHSILSIAMPIYNLNAVTIRQELIDIKMLASSSVIWRIFGRGLIPLGALFGGILSSYFSIEFTIVLTIIITILGIIPLILSNKILKYKT